MSLRGGAKGSLLSHALERVAITVRKFQMFCKAFNRSSAAVILDDGTVRTQTLLSSMSPIPTVLSSYLSRYHCLLSLLI